jgi:antitoxin component of RelBE/YafQ-DinJ toxin-antitoxin module
MRKRKEEAEMIQIRIDPKQKRLLEAAAKRMGLSLSAWLRLVALKAEREQRGNG